MPGFTVAAYVNSTIHGVATYVREDLRNFKVLHFSDENNIFRIVIELFGIKVINIYKPPNQAWPNPACQVELHPAVFVGDFNSHHTQWGYQRNNDNGTSLSNWAESANLFLVHDLKQLPTFYSARWRRSYNPDLCFLTKDKNERPLKTTRKVLKAFPRSQHRPIIITIGTEVETVNSVPKPRWNFQKEDWA